MTTIEWDNGPGPRLHAFVVGVDAYPHAATTDMDPPWARRLLAELRPLSVAAPSATAVVEWLKMLTPEAENIPVGTAEVLISATNPVSISTPNGDIDVDSATTANFVAAFDSWFRRCNSHPDNVALFFFCGHGWHRREQLLLLADIGIRPAAIGAYCVDLAHLRGAMRECAARTQAYFVDACRTLPMDLARIELNESLILRNTRTELPVQLPDNPVFFSTALGQSAYGRSGEPTHTHRQFCRC
jgi:hypothetical protein